MKQKLVGDIEIIPYGDDENFEIITGGQNITLRGKDDVRSLLSILKELDNELAKANGRHLPG